MNINRKVLLKKTRFQMKQLTYCLALLFAGAGQAQINDASELDIIIPNIELRSGVTVNMHVNIIQKLPCVAGTILAIPGALNTGNYMKPLAKSILALPIDGQPVCRVITVDYPARNNSSLPTGVYFGDLTLDDYASAVSGTLEGLNSLNIYPSTIMTLSTGGLVAQIMQDKLIKSGSSLWSKFHVSHALLLAPALPASVPWVYRDSGAGAGLSYFAVNDPDLGMVIDIPQNFWSLFAFSRPDGTTASSALSLEQMVAGNYIVKESMAMMGGMIGIPGYPARPVDPNIFADTHMTKLNIVGFSEDPLILGTDMDLLFPYLTGKTLTDPGRYTLVNSDATHGYPLSNPNETAIMLKNNNLLK